MTDEVLEKEINQFETIDKSVSETITSMGYLWKETLEKFSKDSICFLCKTPIKGESYSIFKVPNDKIEDGMVAFICLCSECNK